MKNEKFLYTIALMGMADYVYKNKKSYIVWMNTKEQLVYNLGWDYCRKQMI